ncbi:EF-P lysine aminoacylase EpmA [Marinobacter sp. V034]|uniref:EF-P lysine aminoacylase EpmA n=1 Tax=Marinobacter sp. V034 TaxID=3459610 RepID=UPI0040449E48
MCPDDSWQSIASLDALRERAKLLSFVRQFFDARDVLEVETPVMARHGVSDIHIDSVSVDTRPAPCFSGGQCFLQTSPEYHMKRLLACGSGAIYQVFRGFRDGERGPRHNPEFSLLEWYRPGFNDHALMDEVGELVSGWLGIAVPERVPYRQLFLEILDVDPMLADVKSLRRLAGEAAGDAGFAADLDRDACLDILMTHCIEPALRSRPAVFVHDYPASQAALARTRIVDGFPVAHRFELYLSGVELCNGYWELTDVAEQRRRFVADNRARRLAGKVEMPIDENLMAALDSGLPDCAGVALGLDRLLMCGLKKKAISDVMAFPIERA